MNVIFIIAIPQDIPNFKVLQNDIDLHISAIIKLKNLHKTLSKSFKFIIINNRRVVYRSGGSYIHDDNIKFELLDNLQTSNVAQDISMVMAGLHLKNKIINKDNTNILQTLRKLNFNNSKIFVSSIHPIEFSEVFLNIKHIIDIEMCDIMCFSPEMKDKGNDELNYDGLSSIAKIDTPNLKNFMKFLLKPQKLYFNENDMNFPVKCFCHGALLKTGLICPICLTPYCKRVGICKICKIKINFG